DVCETVAPFNLTAPTVTGVTGTGSFRSFKNAATSAGLYTPATAGYGVDTIYYRFTTTNNCTDSVKLAINIKARPRGNFTFSPSGCLDATGNVNFTSNVNIPGSTISTYAWEFESPSTSAGNISSSPNPSHVYNAGSYTIKLGLTGANGCTFDTTQNVTFGRKPAINPLTQANVCESITPFNLTAPAITNGATGTGTWSSFKNAATSAGLYTPATAGYGVDTIYYKFTTGVDCYDSVKQAITILARPRANFTFTPNGCLDASGTVNFTSNANVPNSSVTSYAWKFEDPSTAPANTASTANASHNYTDGTYTIRLTVTGANGCSFDTVQTQTFSRKPSISPIVQANVCDNANPFNLTAPSITNGVMGTGTWSSFKNATTSAGLYTPSTAGYGIDTLYYKFTANGGICFDSVKLPITVLARPRATFTFNPTGCLDAAGNITFTSNVNVPNSSVNSYLWKFNDPSASPSSTAANPTHNYTTAGTYTIRLTVTGTNGCSFDTVQTQTFNLKPAISPLVQANVCDNAAAFNLTAPNITNGVIGTGVFSSFKNASTSAGLYNPATAGYGVDTIYYKFTSASGSCADSVKLPITVLARPRATFTFNPTGCLDAAGNITFTSNVNVPNSSVNSYLWKFNDPSASPSSTAANPTHNYTTAGTYTIRLTVTGTNGCSFDTVQTQTFNLKPAISPLVQANVCDNAAAFNLTAPNITNGVIGTGVFSSFKNASTSAGLYNPATAGYGVDTIYYKFTSASGSCADSVKLPITVLARPRANFTFLPNGCLDATGTVNFTSNANVPNSSVSSYLWKFEDPSTAPANTASTANASHVYNDGTYTIRLTVNGA
ncbi:MAG: PKD domain-containing protein, partial [Dolichospermum sp.]